MEFQHFRNQLNLECLYSKAIQLVETPQVDKILRNNITSIQIVILEFEVETSLSINSFLNDGYAFC
jgi:hypothetical protein